MCMARDLSGRDEARAAPEGAVAVGRLWRVVWLVEKPNGDQVGGVGGGTTFDLGLQPQPWLHVQLLLQPQPPAVVPRLHPQPDPLHPQPEEDWPQQPDVDRLCMNRFSFSARPWCD